MNRPSRRGPDELLTGSPDLHALLIPTVREVVPFPLRAGLLPVRPR